MNISRRRAVVTMAMAGGARFFALRPGLQAQAPLPTTKVSFPVPEGACDCHVHVFGDLQRYPFAAARTYTPQTAALPELRALLDALHMDRVVVVQPSVYGTDNRCTLDAVRELGRRARGVAVIDATTPDAALDDMAHAGIRGIRLNLTQVGVSDPAVARQRFQTAAERAKKQNWHIQFNTSLKIIAAMSTELLASPVPLVIDHFGGATAAAGVEQPGFDALVTLVKSGTAYVKISGAADLISTATPDYADVLPLARALVAANSRRVLWGSNWPHPDSRTVPGRRSTDIAPLVQTDDGRVLNLLADWVPDPGIRRTILVENPARLYGFT
jgi:predicted TIM-barrel fold metal-dependent hydrolase